MFMRRDEPLSRPAHVATLKIRFHDDAGAASPGLRYADDALKQRHARVSECRERRAEQATRLRAGAVCVRGEEERMGNSGVEIR